MGDHRGPLGGCLLQKGQLCKYSVRTVRISFPPGHPFAADGAGGRGGLLLTQSPLLPGTLSCPLRSCPSSPVPPPLPLQPPFSLGGPHRPAPSRPDPHQPPAHALQPWLCPPQPRCHEINDRQWWASAQVTGTFPRARTSTNSLAFPVPPVPAPTLLPDGSLSRCCCGRTCLGCRSTGDLEGHGGRDSGDGRTAHTNSYPWPPDSRNRAATE